jgi:hypothetical protein
VNAGIRIAHLRSADGQRSAVISFRPSRNTYRARFYGQVPFSPVAYESYQAGDVQFHSRSAARIFNLAVTYVDAGVAAFSEAWSGK